MKQRYKAPSVIGSATVEVKNNILAGSVVTKNTKIETAGQPVETKSFDTAGFNSTWE